MNHGAICSSVQKKKKLKWVRCRFAEISAHHRGHQPQVQGGRGGRWRGWARPAHQVHSQSGGNCDYYQESRQQLSPKRLREISPSCGKSLISPLPCAKQQQGNERMPTGTWKQGNSFSSSSQCPHTHSPAVVSVSQVLERPRCGTEGCRSLRLLSTLTFAVYCRRMHQTWKWRGFSIIWKRKRTSVPLLCSVAFVGLQCFSQFRKHRFNSDPIQLPQPQFQTSWDAVWKLSPLQTNWVYKVSQGVPEPV